MTKAIKETAPQGPVLTEELDSSSLECVEEDVPGKKEKKFVIRGHFGNVNVATANKRVYPQALMEREIARLEKAMKDRNLYGELDHPSSQDGDSATKLNRVSHIITSLKIEGNKVFGTAETLGTDAGRNLRELLKAGCKVGVSSRGHGTTTPDSEGNAVVNTDFKLVTFDVVAEPAAGAYPGIFLESKNGKIASKDVTASMVAEAFPVATSCITEAAVKAREVELEAQWAQKVVESTEQVKQGLQEQFTDELLSAVAKAKKELYAEVTADVLKDPAFAGAKQTVESIKQALMPYLVPNEFQNYTESVKLDYEKKTQSLQAELAEAKLKITALESSSADSESTLRELGYRLYLEQVLDGNAEGRTMVGDLKNYPDAASIKIKAEEVKAILAARKSSAQVESAPRVVEKIVEKIVSSNPELEKEFAKAAARADKAEMALETLQSKLQKEHSVVEQLSEQLDAAEFELAKAKEAAEVATTKLYAEQKLTKNPNAGKIRNVLESTNPRSRKSVDAITESFREPVRDPEALDQVRARIRASTRGGMERMPMEEEVRPTTRSEGSKDLAGLGVSLSDFRKFSGVKK